MDGILCSRATAVVSWTVRPYLSPMLPEVVRELVTTLVMVDTIMNGADVVASMALVHLIGRAYLYGLMAGGRRGVDRTSFSDEVRRTMKTARLLYLQNLSPSTWPSCAASRSQA